MIIGVFIVLFGYILGNFNNITQAQKDDFPVYENLLVTDTLLVGNPSKHYVEITAKDNATSIGINTAKKGLCGRISITADDNGSRIIISHSAGYKLDDHVNSVIWMSADQNEVANIFLADKKGRNDLN